MPFLAALEMNENCRPIRIKMSQVSGFTLEAINGWTKEHVVPGSTVFTDGLGCFRGVAEAGSNQVASRSPSGDLMCCRRSSCAHSLLQEQLGSTVDGASSTQTLKLEGERRKQSTATPTTDLTVQVLQ